ncbi:hypothetical protein KM043_015161 [Ampulex compressa]|nr:hypothetical protein KM043_015161 [Ampulex compressa]
MTSQTHQSELIKLAELAGISTHPGVFRIILELLALQVSPEDIYILLKDICSPYELSESVKSDQHISNIMK